MNVISEFIDRFGRVERAPMAERVDREVHRDQGCEKARKRAHVQRLLTAIEAELGRQQRRHNDGLLADTDDLRKVLTMFRDMP